MAETAEHSGRLPDEELVTRARVTGGARYLEQLLHRHRPSIFRRCLAIVRDPDDAEDITQEVLLRVFRGLDGFQGRSSFRTWLYSIVQHECWTYTARRERHTIPEETRIKMELHFSSEGQARPGSSSWKQLHRVLAKMPNQAREVLHLRYLRELPIPQIALLLGTSLSATKMRVHRALSLSQNLMDAMSIRLGSAQLEDQMRFQDKEAKFSDVLDVRRYANTAESSKFADQRFSS